MPLIKKKSILLGSLKIMLGWGVAARKFRECIGGGSKKHCCGPLFASSGMSETATFLVFDRFRVE